MHHQTEGRQTSKQTKELPLVETLNKGTHEKQFLHVQDQPGKATSWQAMSAICTKALTSRTAKPEILRGGETATPCGEAACRQCQVCLELELELATRTYDVCQEVGFAGSHTRPFKVNMAEVDVQVVIGGWVV